MKTFKEAVLLFAITLAVVSFVHAQDLRAFNQNASRSNHSARASIQSDNSWSFGASIGNAVAVKSNASTLFRGNSLATKMFGRYYFGNIGLGFTNGIIPGAINSGAVNRFLTDRKLSGDQVQVSQSKPLTGYLLFGPSVRFGHTVEINADLQGGVFLNDPGSLAIAEKGAARPLYRFDGGSKNLFPGFSGSLQVAYPINRSTRFFIHTDYVQSKTDARLYDPQQGMDVVTEQTGALQLFTAGIGITKSFGMKPGPGSGQATGKRMKVDGGMPSRISMNVTTSRQTQGSTFGEKVSSGLHMAGSARGIISGTVRWMDENAYGIITNEMAAVSSIGAVKHSGGGAASASYARMANSSGNTPQDVSANIYVRDAVTGLPTGKRLKDHSSGMATGRRQYSLVFNENGNNDCPGCDVSARVAAHEAAHVVQQSSVAPTHNTNNPLYNGGGHSGSNPMFEQKSRTTDNGAVCGATGHFLIVLVDAASGQPVAKTTTDSCGNFWFANVPEGNYALRTKGEVAIKKSYEVNINDDGKYDIAGEMIADDKKLLIQVNAAVADNTGQNRKVVVRGWDPEKKQNIAGTADKNAASPGENTMPGGSVVTAAFVAGNPIGGIIVKGGKNPGGSMIITETNEQGEFEFTGLGKGSYTFAVDFKYAIDESIEISLDDDNDGVAERKSWGAAGNGGAKAGVQDHNSSRSNKSASFVENDPDNTGEGNTLRAQNNNTVKSNRTELKSILAEADLDGDGIYETDVTGKINEEITIDENGNIAASQQKSGVMASGNNRPSFSVKRAADGLYIAYGSATINNKNTPVRTVLKTKHDTAKNSISNVR